jgi:hypothetical protein
MLRMLSFDVVDMWCWDLCRGGATDVGCCTQHGSQHGRNMGCCVEEEGLLMLDVARNTGRNMDWLSVVPGRRRREEAFLMLDVARNMDRNICSLDCNICSLDCETGSWRLIRSPSDGHEGVRC